MCDIDHISVSVGPPVTCDYRIDRNGTVADIIRNEALASEPKCPQFQVLADVPEHHGG